jgi:tetratricopeptide (TPR) repeat protein
MPIVADDLVAWLISLIADAGRKKLITWVLGNEQERALRQAATAAVQLTAEEICAEGGERAEELAIVISHVFSEPLPRGSLAAQATLLQAFQAGIAEQLAVLDEAKLTGTSQSSAQVLGVPAALLADRLTAHMIREIIIRGSRGGALGPLAAQLNHDVTHLQGQRLEQAVRQLTDVVREAIARLDTSHAATTESAEQSGPGLPPSSLVVRYSLPPDTAAFTGRDEELDRIMIAVTAAAQAGGVISIHAIDGMPGVGKTTLAVRAAYRLRQQFPDRQLFINLHGHTPGRKPVLPGAALAGLLRATGVDGRYLPGDLEGRVNLWRDRMVGLRILLVLDNASSSAQVAPLLPSGDRCLVLVTSRRHLGDLPGNTVAVLLGVLPPVQAQEMFMRLAPRSAAELPDAIAELVRLAGFLPLAISLLARVYARHPSWALADLITETKASMLTLTAEKANVAAAFDVSYRYLEPGQQRFFRVLGLHLGTTIDPYAAAALASTSLEEATAHLADLEGEGLLTEVGYRRYGMHDLTRRYARERADTDTATDRDLAVDRLMDYYQHTAALAESRLARQNRSSPAQIPAKPPTAVPDLRDRTRALAWARAERANLLACLDLVTEAHQHARVVAFTSAVTSLLRQDGPWTDAITRHTAAVRAAQRLGDRMSEADALDNLGIAHQMAGDFPAATEALEAALAIYGDLGDRLGQANALRSIGTVRRQRDDEAGAAGALETALAIYRELGDQPGQANVLNALGVVRRLTGDYPEAAQLHEQALQLYRVLGNRLDEASAFTFLGAALLHLHDYPGAAQAVETALGISGDIGDRQGQVNALTFLGPVRRLVGDNGGAVQAHEEALSISREIGDRLGQVNALYSLGLAHRLAGDFLHAAEALEQSLGIARGIGSRIGEANALKDLGIVHRMTGNIAASAQSLETALQITHEVGDRLGEVETLNELGKLYLDRNDLQRAVALHQQALDLAREIASSWDEAHALACLGHCHLATGRTGDAEASLRQALEIFRRIGAAEAASISAELEALTGTEGSSHAQ